MSEEKRSNAEAQDQEQGQKWDQEWPPFRASSREEDTGDAPDESDAYRAKMEAMAERGDDYDPLLNNLEDGTPLEGESERAQKSNHFDYHPKQKGEDNADYSRRSAWERMVREKSEEFPRLRGKESGHPDESDETDEEWYARVGIPSYEEFMAGDGEEGDAEETGEKSLRDRWAEMSNEEKKQFIHEHPRNPGEKTEAWARRIGLLEDGPAEGDDSDEDAGVEDGADEDVEDIESDTDAEEAAEEADVEAEAEAEEDAEAEETDDGNPEAEDSAEFDREVALGVLGAEEAQDWLKGRYTPGQLEKMSDEELEAVYKEYLDSLKDKTEDEEENEDAEHERLLLIVGDEDFQNWLGNRYRPSDLVNMSNEELQRLIDEYNNREGAEDGEDMERERLLGIIGGEDFQDWLGNRYTPAEILKMSNEELQKLIDEYNRRGGAEEEEEEEGEEDGEEEAVEVDDPLVAVALNREKDARDAAHDIAEHMLASDLQSHGKIYNIVFGSMFREAKVQHYEKQAYEMIIGKQRGSSSMLSERDWSTKAGLETFVQAYVRGTEEEMIHGDAGEKMDTYGLSKDEEGHDVVTHYWVDENGQRHEEVVGNDSPEGKATITMHEAIAEYARTGDKKAFRDSIATLNQELAQAGGNPDALMADNYMTVAEAARDRAEHGKSIEDVMDGFRFINGEARTNIRTEAHRDALDRITNRLANSAIGKFLPPEVIGTAASAAVFFGKTPVRAALVAAGTVAVGASAGAVLAVPIAVGAGMAGITSALKERSRVTGERADQARDLARGDDIRDIVVPTSGKRRQIKAAEKAKKAAEELEKTQYDTVDATEITSALNEAVESGDIDRITRVFAQADTLVKMSDRRGIDLISYSNADADIISNERMQLDIARATAKTKLRELGVDDVRAHISDAVESATESLENDISAKDKVFRSLRARRASKQGLKSAVISAAFSIGLQEGAAMIDQSQVGLVESGVNSAARSVIGHEITHNASDARNTLLAGLVGLKTVNNYDAILQQGAELTDAERARLENDPNYTVIRGADKITTTEETVSTSEAMDALPDGYRSNWLGNGTKGSDGNELRGYYSSDRGVYTHLQGKSWGGGQTIETSSLTSDDVGFVVKFGDTTKFIPATGANGDFAPDLSGQPSWVADAINGRHFSNISCVYNNGIDSSGAVMGSSFWTFSGDGNLPATVTTTVESTVPTWDVVQHITETADRAIAAPVFVAAPISRVNLPPMKHREAPKPENIGGAPRTRIVERGSDPASGGGGGETPSPRSPEGGAETEDERPIDMGPFDDSFGGRRGEAAPDTETETEVEDEDEAPAEAPEASEEPAEAAPEAPVEAPDGGDEETTGEGSMEDFTPIKFDSADSRITLTDDQLREQARKRGRELSAYDMETLRQAIDSWNAAEPLYRTRALDGKRKVEHRTMADYGPQMTNTVAPILEDYGLVTREEDIEPTEAEESGEDMGMAA